jgi:hypothetical protein
VGEEREREREREKDSERENGDSGRETQRWQHEKDSSDVVDTEDGKGHEQRNISSL